MTTQRITCLILFGLSFVATARGQIPNGQPGTFPPNVPVLQEPAVPPIEATPAQPPAQSKSILQIIKNGGLMMLPIGFCSVLLFVFVFERMVSLRRGRVIPRPFVKRFLEQIGEGSLEMEQAVGLCEENGSPVARVFAAAAKKWGRTGVEIEQAIMDEGERATNELRRFTRMFNAISTVSPMLGLMGTVVGMIQSFNALVLAGSNGRQEALAKGIAEALITTAAGLMVAVPALIAYWFFVSRVDSLIMEIDALGQKVVNLIASDGWRVERTESETQTKQKRKAKAAA